MKKQKCNKCNELSIPNLARGHGKCRYHWAELIWGKDWADKMQRDDANLEDES